MADLFNIGLVGIDGTCRGTMHLWKQWVIGTQSLDVGGVGVDRSKSTSHRLGEEPNELLVVAMENFRMVE
ncbi:hypothetical protein HAX54_051489, partial [Datura stramonium]|nr:hypothetical protein [Datura stramonium]